jgi:aspartate dehydrogenase
VNGVVPRLKVGIAGVGAIGSALIRRFPNGDVDFEIVAAVARDVSAARSRIDQAGNGLAFVSFDALAERCDLVVEAMPSAMFARIAEPTIKAGKIFMPLSVGALLDRLDLVERARETGARILVPSGALLGLDAVRAAAEGEIRSAKIITRKGPASLIGAPYLIENQIDLRGLNAPLRVFNGSARDGARGFPANVNVAAALSLAGIGPDRTHLEIWADPGLERNIHHVEIDSDSSRFSMTVESVPSEENPRTGKLTVLSVIAAIRGLTAPLRLGS